MTMMLTRDAMVTSAELARTTAPLLVEFTSARARTRPLAGRIAGIEIADGRLPVRAVDIDRWPELRRRFRVDLVPTFIIVHEEQEVARFIGPHSRRELTSAVRRALDPRLVRLTEPPQARGLWNDFTVRLWGFGV